MKWRFRLVNAVLAYPPESPTIHRIAGALGDVGHLALASACQNFFILRVLAKVVSPGTASFCTFAAVALIFDFFFHLTFFVAMLSVDARRMELQDSIDRANLVRRINGNSRTGRQSWIEALLQGRLPISSRLAGSAISVCFVLVMNMHFFDNESTLWALIDSIKSMLAWKDRITENGSSFSPPSINQARTPAAWLRIQDYNSAQEVIKFIKPDAHTIIARVYDPIIIVLHGSDRTGVPRKTTSYLTTMSTILDQHLYPLILVVIFAVAFTTLLMQYLLWNELSEEDTDVNSTPVSILSVKTLPKVHKLDIVKLTTCSKGHLITIGLDRITAISLFDTINHTYSFSALNTTKMTPPFWPINEIAIDDNGTWAALCAGDGYVAFWNLPERRLSHFLHANFQGQKPLLFSLNTIERADVERLSLIVCLPDGQVNEFDIQRSTAVQQFHLGQGRLQSASVVRLGSSIKLIAAGRDGNIHIATNHFGEWTLMDLRAVAKTKTQMIKSLAIAPAIGLIVVARLNSLDVMDLKTHSTIYTLPTRVIKRSTLRLLSSQRRDCPVCHSCAVHSISFVYTHGVEGTCVMRTFTPGDEHNSLICLRPHNSGEAKSCKGFLDATETIHHIEGPGSWEATGGQAVIGIRKLAITSNSSTIATGVDLTADTDSSIRQRRSFFWPTQLAKPLPLSALNAVTKPPMNESEEWEVWTLSSTGEFSNIRLQDAPDTDNELFVASTGPVVRLGKRSVVIAFGNVIKVVTLGHGRFEEDVDGYDDSTPQVGSARRRKQVIRR
jgi:WD40 repeat protein